MPTRSQVDLLPQEVRAELDSRLIQNGFGDYLALVEWLQEQGYEISKSSLHRYGQRFEDKVAALRVATQQAQEMRVLLKDDEAAVSEMSLQMVQGLLFNLMIDRGEDLEPQEMTAIARAITEASRGTMAVKKYQEKLHQQLAAKFAELEKESQDNGLAGGKLDPETLKYIRESIYGLI